MNRTILGGESLPVPRSVSRRRLAMYATMVLIGGCLVWIFAPKPAAKPEVIILPPNYSVPPQQGRIPDRWLPNSPAWPRKLCFAVLGQPFQAQLDLRMFRFRGQAFPWIAMDRHLPLVASNGVIAWILPEVETNLIEQRLQNEGEGSYSARFITMAGMSSAMSSRLPKIEGISLTPCASIACAVRNRANALELISTFVSSEVATNAQWRAPDASEPVTLETNLTIAAKMQIPTGHSVFLYDTNRTDTRGTTAGVLVRWRIWTTVPPPRASGRSMQPLK